MCQILKTEKLKVKRLAWMIGNILKVLCFTLIWLIRFIITSTSWGLQVWCQIFFLFETFKMIKIYSHANTRHFISWLIMIVCCHNISWERFENTLWVLTSVNHWLLCYFTSSFWVWALLDFLLPVSDLLSPCLATIRVRFSSSLSKAKHLLWLQTWTYKVTHKYSCFKRCLKIYSITIKMSIIYTKIY